MTLRHRVERGPRFQQAMQDLVQVQNSPSAAPAESRHLAQVFTIECQVSVHNCDPRRVGMDVPRESRRILCLSGTRYCVTWHSEFQGTPDVQALSPLHNAASCGAHSPRVRQRDRDLNGVNSKEAICHVKRFTSSHHSDKAAIEDLTD